jgi:hypothetical protein
MIVRVPTTNDAVKCAPVSCGPDVHNLMETHRMANLGAPKKGPNHPCSRAIQVRP